MCGQGTGRWEDRQAGGQVVLVLLLVVVVLVLVVDTEHCPESPGEGQT